MKALFNPLPETTLDERPSLRTPIRTPRQYTPYDTRTEFQKGLESGRRRFEGGLRGAVAMGATALGADEFARSQARTAAEVMVPQPQDAPRISDINQVESFKDLWDYVEYGLGSTVASTAAGTATGGVVGAARGLTAGAAAAGALSGAEQGGALFAEEVQRLPDRDPREIAAASAVAGAGMGALDALPLVRAFDRLGAGRMGRRIVTNAFKSAGEEGATEGAQTLIERNTRAFLDDNYDVFDEEGRNELLNAVAMGGLIGGGLGGASGVLPSSPFRDRVADLEAEDELRRLRVGKAANALRELDPESGPLVDGLVEADDIDGLEDLVVNRSTAFGFTGETTFPDRAPDKNYGDSVRPSREGIMTVTNPLSRGTASDIRDPASLPLPTVGDAGFSDVQRRARLTLENFHKRKAERARARAQASFAREAEDRDQEIADLLGQLEDDSNQAAPEIDDFADPDDVADFDYTTGRTLNLDAFEEDLSPETTLSRRAYEAGYMVDENTGEMMEIDASPAERAIAAAERNRPDLAAESRPLDEYLAEQFQMRNNQRGQTMADAINATKGPQALDEFFAREAERVYMNELARDRRDNAELSEGMRENARRAKKKMPEGAPKGKREAFLERAYQNMTPQEFLNLFDTTQRHKVPRQLRSDPESAVLEGSDSVVVDVNKSSEGARSRVQRAWEQGKHLWMTYIEDAKGARAIRMPTTLKGYYERTLGNDDINDATPAELFDAFVRFNAELNDKGYSLAQRGDMIIGVINGAPVTLSEARSQADEGRNEFRRKEEFARRVLEEKVKEAAAAYRDSGSESDLLALESARDELDQFDDKRAAEVALDSSEWEKRAADADDMNLPSPEFASKEAVRFRTNYNALAKQSAARAKDRKLAEKLSQLAVTVMDMKDGAAIAELLKSSLSPAMQEAVKKIAGTLKPGLSQRSKLVDALDALALRALEQSAGQELKTGLTLRRDDELLAVKASEDIYDKTTSQKVLAKWKAARGIKEDPAAESAAARERMVRHRAWAEKRAAENELQQQHAAMAALDEMEIDRSTAGLNGWNAGRAAAPTVRKFEVRESRILNDWLRAFGVKRTVTFVTADEIYGLKPSAVSDKVRAALRQEFLGNTRGAAIRVNKQAELFVAINPSVTDQRVRQAVLAHELGHAVFKDFVYGHLTKGTLVRDMQTEFEAWLKKTEGKSLGDVLASKLAKDLFEAYAEDPSVDMTVRLRSLPQDQIDYYLSFEEWFADQTSRWLKRQKPLPPEGRVARFFWRAAELLRAIWGVFEEQEYRPAASVDAFLRGTVYRAHGVYADRWIETLSGHIPYPQDVVRAVDQTLLAPHAAEVLNAALLQRLGPFTDQAIRQTRRAFDALLKPEERRVVGRVMSAWHVRKQILDYVGANHPALFDRAVADPTMAMAIGYQMWVQSNLNLGPDGKNLYTKLDKALDDAFGLVSQHQQAETVLTALQSGLMTLRRHNKGYFVLRSRTARDTVLKRAGQATMDAYKALAPLVEGLLYPVQRRLLNTGVPELRRLAEMMAPIAGQQRADEPYLVAKSRRLAELQGRYQRMAEQWDEDLKRDVWDLLYDPDRLKTAKDSEAVRAARKVQALFRLYRRYAGDTLDMGTRQDYFPWVFNTQVLHEDAPAFLAMLRQPKHAAKLAGIAKAWGVSDYNDVPQMILDRILDEKGNATLGNAPRNIQHSPFFGFSAVRVLDFLYIDGTQAERDVLRSWMDQNLDHTVYMYTEQLAKRVEFTKRFGKNGDALTVLLKQAEANGASQEEIALAHDFVAAMLGYHGRETNRALHRLFGKEAPENEVINPVLKNVMAGTIVVQNLALLGLATFTSLIDPLTVGVRTGSFSGAMRAYRVGLGEVVQAIKNQVPGRQKQMSRAEELARGIGIIEERLVMESLSWQYSSTYLPHWMNTINEGFFKLIMLNQWTQLTRTMATAGAEQFLLAHRKGKGDSGRYLAELGLRVGDVKKVKGQLKILTREERAKATPEERAADDRVRAALFQFVDESIIRPSPNTRALWMSDPHFMLIGHLKGFMFAFHEQILRRVWNEVGHRNWGPGLMLLSLVPAMMAANMLRAAFKEGLTGEEPPDDPFFQAFWEAMQRAGLTGIFQVFFDAKRDVEYGGTPLDSALGPAWDNTVSKIPEIMSGDESAIVDQLPLQNLFGSVYEEVLPIE